MQYITATNGAWQTVPAANVTWDVPYETAYNNSVRQYHLTLNPPLADVWGIRLQGNAQPGVDDVAIRGGTPRQDGAAGTGFIGVSEFTVYGEVNLGELDLSINMALGATGIMNFKSGSLPHPSPVDRRSAHLHRPCGRFLRRGGRGVRGRDVAPSAVPGLRHGSDLQVVQRRWPAPR